jgi:hypothetical protein
MAVAIRNERRLVCIWAARNRKPKCGKGPHMTPPAIGDSAAHEALLNANLERRHEHR